MVEHELELKNKYLGLLKDLEVTRKRLLSALFKVCGHPNVITFSGYELCKECDGKRTHKPCWGEAPEWDEWKPTFPSEDQG